MGITRKKWFTTAVILMILGMTIFVSVACSGRLDFKGNYETNTCEIHEEFSDIVIKTDTADIVFLPSEDEVCKVTCYEKENLKHSVGVVDGTLEINAVDTRKWYDYISFYEASKITVYLPEQEYGSLNIEESTGDIDLPNRFAFGDIDISVSTGDVYCAASVANNVKIEASTGDVCLENMSANSVDVSVSTGEVSVSNVACVADVKIVVSTGKSFLSNIICENLISKGSTGDVSLQSVIATGKFSIDRSTGDVKFEASDAGEIFVTTDTGDVRGTLLSEKVFITQTDTGRVEVPNSVVGGRCEITTDTGDIKISIV